MGWFTRKRRGSTPPTGNTALQARGDGSIDKDAYIRQIEAQLQMSEKDRGRIQQELDDRDQKIQDLHREVTAWRQAHDGNPLMSLLCKAFDRLQDSVMIAFTDGRLVYGNAAAEAMFGPIAGRQAHHLFLDDLRAPFRLRLEDTQVGKPPNVPPGHELWKTVVDPEQNEIGGCVQERVEIRNVDHEALDVALTMQLLEDQSGQPCFVLIEALDIGSLAKDELTKLFRREVAIRVLTREIEFREKDKRMIHQPISVAFADIDDFKGINTRHTDLGGDAVLRKMGKVLQGCARAESKDLICRWYSGDEFLAVIFGDHAAALQVANRMDEGIKASETVFTDAAGRTETIKVTASIGVATWEPGDTYEDLVRRAIESKSFSKGAGKGRVTGQMPPLDRTLIDFAAAAKKSR